MTSARETGFVRHLPNKSVSDYKQLKKYVTSGSDFVFIFVIHAYFSGFIIFL